MADSNKYNFVGFETTALHAGQEYDQWSNLEIVPPIVTSATFYQNDPTNMKDHYYSRISNPTRSSVEKCLAALDNAKHALVFPSGCAAVTALLHILNTGDHIVLSIKIFGGTRVILLDYAKMHGIELDFVDSVDVKQVENAIKSNTKLVFLETPSNPCLEISDIEAIAKIAHSRKDQKIVVAVDNTFLTPYFQRPLELGADVVMYSLTKYMNGHNDVTAGALIVNDDEIHKRLKFVQTNYGSVLSPFDCYLVNRGLKTLALRMRQHCENGLAVARFLETHPKVSKVYHPGLPSHPHYELAKKQSTGHCGMVSFNLKGTADDTVKFVRNCRIFLSLGSLGSTCSHAVIPFSVSQKSLPKEVKESLGIFESTIRLSVGIEHSVDLIKDLEQAFEKTFE